MNKSDEGSDTVASIATCCAAKLSDMYFRKIRPSTMCLYSAASICAASYLLSSIGL